MNLASLSAFVRQFNQPTPPKGGKDAALLLGSHVSTGNKQLNE